MTIIRIAAAGTAIAFALAWASSPMAQIAPSAFTAENIAPDNPFGELPVDMAAIDITDIEAYLSTMTVEQRPELQQRCVVIVGNSEGYATEAVALCEAVIAAAEAAGI